MEIQRFRQDKPAVLDALRRGERPLMATTTAAGPVDELLALHIELSVPGAGHPAAARMGAGADPGRHQRPQSASRRPAGCVLALSPGRHARCLPARRNPRLASGPRGRGRAALYNRRLIRGKVDAIDGTGLGDDFRLVCLVCVSGQRPGIVAWRLLDGPASEKGREAQVTRALIEQALALGGPECINLLLADASYAAGPLIAWLAYPKGIDVLTPLPADRRMFADALGLARGGTLSGTRPAATGSPTRASGWPSSGRWPPRNRP